MSYTTTPNLHLYKPTINSDNDQWGTHLNANADTLDGAVPAASSTTPNMDGTAAVGTLTTYARGDHIHPSDTSRLPLSGGVLTGALTPSQTAGIVGTTTNNNANAGAVGEFVTAVRSTNLALSNNVDAIIISISLTPGDWDVQGNASVSMSASASVVNAYITTTLGSPNADRSGYVQFAHSTSNVSNVVMPTGVARFSLAATTTINLCGSATFASGTANAVGVIMARRVR